MNKKIAIVTITVAIVVGLGGFFGGTVYEKNKLSSQGLLRANANGQRRGPGQGGQGMAFSRGGGPNNQNGDFVAGQVISKDDKSITIKTNDGGSKIVFFSDSTTIGKSVQGSSGDLSTGEQVMVNGQANPDGSLAAQNIQIRPASPELQRGEPVQPPQ